MKIGIIVILQPTTIRRYKKAIAKLSIMLDFDQTCILFFRALFKSLSLRLDVAQVLAVYGGSKPRDNEMLPERTVASLGTGLFCSILLDPGAASGTRPEGGREI